MQLTHSIATVEAMEALGADRARIRAAIGPTIQQASYEVGPEFRDSFLAKDAASEDLFIPGQGDRWQERQHDAGQQHGGGHQAQHGPGGTLERDARQPGRLHEAVVHAAQQRRQRHQEDRAPPVPARWGTSERRI